MLIERSGNEQKRNCAQIACTYYCYVLLLELSSPSFVVKSCDIKYLLFCLCRMIQAVNWICLAEGYNTKISLNLLKPS